MHRLLLLGFAAVTAAGCATTGGGGDRTFSNPNLLTRAQIEEVRATDAYEVVQRLRSRWLRAQGTTQLPNAAGDFQVQVYLDEVHQGGVSELRDIGYQEIQYIRYYPPQQASARWGFDHGAGAIMVSTRPLNR